MKNKTSIIISNTFQKCLDDPNRKPNKLWVDKGSRFYSRPMKLWLQDKNIKMHSISNEGKHVVAERFIGTLKKKFYKYLTPISRNVYIDESADKINEYNNTYHRTIKMQPIDIKSGIYINFVVEHIEKDPKCEVGYYVVISKYSNSFAKAYTSNCSEEVF